ncbi:hypothetical protein DLJ53_20735 [Acuticoccus sediminis]|uniref:Uncharacterized protein n=1 Tax=Acuticoccus sediminis TaxID=2184697 RepID=A0A8B2NPE2_9HYPH|nr:hypothetical protein DLJ53_20735 [Acuticoccus sediminis]
MAEAPSWFGEVERAAWDRFRAEIPWLTEADRVLVEVASTLRARLATDPAMSVNAIAQLRMCLSAMGATPADRSRVDIPQNDDDPLTCYFN